MPDVTGESAANSLEIGKEYPPPNEAAVIRKLADLHLQIHHKQPGPDRRGEHPKTHAGVWARFTVATDIPRQFRTGVFAEERSYTALVRYSNGRNADDRLPDAHGMAIKVLISQAGNPAGAALQQDFVLADHAVFFARNVQHILVCPPRLVVIINIFWKTTHIHDAKMRIDIGPRIWRWFAPIIEARPYKTAEPIFIRGR